MKVRLNPTNNTTTLRDIKFGEAFKHEGSTWIRIYNEEHDENLGNTASVVNLNTGVEAERPWDTIVEPISGTFVENGAETENEEITDLKERIETLRETVQNYKDLSVELDRQNTGLMKKLQICENANEQLREDLNAKSNNCVPLVGLNAVFDFSEETIKKINDILSPIDRSLDDWEITTVESLLQMVVSVAVDLRTLTVKLSTENSTKTLSIDDITELEKQLFTAGIDIKLHTGNEINIIKQLVKTIVEQEKSYLNLLHNASKLPIELQRNLSTLLSDAGIDDIDLDNPNTASLISTLVHSYVTDHISCRNLLDKCRAFADSVLEAEEPVLDYSDDDFEEPTD